MKSWLRSETCLPEDHSDAVLVARAWIPSVGPTPVLIQGDEVLDLSGLAATSSQLLDLDDPVAVIQSSRTLPRLYLANASR